MIKRTSIRVRVLSLLTALSMVTAAPAQQIITGGSALQNASTAGARAPGNMVTAGLARALDGPTITEIALPGWFEDIFEPQATDLIANQISDAIVFLFALVLARAGAGFTIPTDLSTGSTPDAGSADDGASGGSRDPRGVRSRVLR